MALSYRDEVLADSPTYYYEFNESSGNITSTTTAFAGSALGTPVRQQAGIPNGGYSVFLDGTGEGFQIGLPDFVANTNWTIECWIKHPTGVTETSTTFFRRHNSSTGGPPQVLARGEMSGHKIQFYWTARTATSTADYNDGNWHHIVLKRTGASSMSCFIDGVAVSQTGTGGWTSPGTSQPFYIGTDNTTANEDMYGYIAQFAIYSSTALSDTRIQDHYLAGISATPQATPMTSSALMPQGSVAVKNAGYAAQPMTASSVGPLGSKLNLQYRNEVLADNPNTYYEFNETSGTTLVNTSSPGTLNAVHNSATINQNGPAPGYKAISRDGTGDDTTTGAMLGVTYPTTVLNANTNYSFEFWFKTNESMGVTISEDWHLFRTATGSSGGVYTRAWLDRTTGYLKVKATATNETTDPIDLAYNVALDDQAWHHVAVTCSGSGTDQWRLYVDGAQRATDTAERSTVSGSGRIVMGFGGDGAIGTDNPCNISIAQVATYTTTLSGSRVLAHYNAMNSVSWSDAPMTATALMRDPSVVAQRSASYASQVMTASSLVVNPSVLAVDTISYVATPMTASSLMPDAEAVEQQNVTYNAQVMTGSTQFVFPGLPSYNHLAVPMTVSALMRDPGVIPGFSGGYNSQPMTAVSLMRESAEANDPKNHPYYKAVRNQVDSDDIWLPFLDVSGTKATEEVSEIFNLSTWSRTNSKYFGGMLLGLNGPDDRLAANFDGTDDYIQVGELTDDTNTGTYSIEFVFRTSRPNQVIMAGQEVSSEGFAPGSAILRAVQVNTRDGRISLLGTGPGIVGNNYQELLIGDKNVADGEWHHVVISSWWYPANRSNDYTGSEARGSMGIWIDGKLDKRYSSINVNFRMSRPDYVGRSITGQGNYFEGDMSMLVARRGYGIPKYTIEQNYYAALAVNPIRVPPMTSIDTMPNAKGRGNSVRVLNVYLRNTQAGTVEVDQSKVYYDARNGRLNTNVIAWTSANNTGGYRDSVTDERRLINFQTDINMDNYDIINVVDGNLLTNGSNTTRMRTDEYLATALGTSKGRANVVLDDFYRSLKQVVKDTNKAIFIRDPEVARRAGLIGNYTTTLPVREKSLASTGKPFWGQLGAGLVDEYDYWAWRNNPWSNFNRNPIAGSADWNNDNEYQYEDTHYLSGERIVATENGLTNLVGPTLAEVINKIHANPLTRTGQEFATRYDMNVSGLQIGQEVLFQTRVYDKYTPGPKDNLPIFSVAPENVLYGTVIATELAEDWVGRNRPVNSRANYATTIIIKEGQLLEGEEVQGRIAMSFNNDIAAPSTIRMGLVGTNETVAEKRFQMSTYRSGGSYIAVDMNGNVIGVSAPQPGGAPAPSPSDNTTQTWFVFQPAEQASYQEVNGDMGRRIFLWLSAGTDNPGDGDVLVGVESMTGSGSMPSPVVVGQKHIAISADNMNATSVMLDNADEDAVTLVTPMLATSKMNMTEKKIAVEPMTATSVMLDDYNAMFERGIQVTLTLARTANKTVILYLRSDN